MQRPRSDDSGGRQVAAPIPDPLLIEPQRTPLRGTIRVPGSKSLTNRAYVLAALAEGRTLLRGPLHADDTDRLLAALEVLGCVVERDDGAVTIEGGGGRLRRGGSVDLRDGGTPTRFLLALATRAQEVVLIDGSSRMRERPVDEGIALLRQLGASIAGTMIDGVERLPVRVEPGATLRGGTLVVERTASSQFISALLLIAPTCRETLELRYAEPPTSGSYLDLTVDAMRSFGIAVDEWRDERGSLLGHRVTPQAIRSATIDIEPDASSAVYPALAAALLPGSEVTLPGWSVGSRQPDLAFFDALGAMGAAITRSDSTITVRSAQPLKGINIDASRFPDAAMALAVACAAARGPSRIGGLETLRVKETDRIAALATELSRLGCGCRATTDALVIEPARLDSEAVRPVSIHTYRDHRMAMSFAILGLRRPGISIVDPQCVTKSYPGFWSDLEQLRR